MWWWREAERSPQFLWALHWTWMNAYDIAKSIYFDLEWGEEIYKRNLHKHQDKLPKGLEKKSFNWAANQRIIGVFYFQKNSYENSF